MNDKNYEQSYVHFFLLQLASVDVIGALDMFAEKGEWSKCLQTAEQQVRAKDINSTEVFFFQWCQVL